MKARLLLSVTAFLALPALAQQAGQAEPQAEAADVEGEEEIVVSAQRQRGAVVGDIKPELQLNPADIRALGTSSVTELLAELAPQLGGGDAQPVVLLEGRRISGFREIATLPSEAIARVDILPAEVALKYGFPIGQKVVNIVLRQRFRASTVELEDRFATAGGANNVEGQFGFLRIGGGGRINIDLKYDTTNPLLESQRGIDAGGAGQYRTLLPSEQQFTASAIWNRIIAGDVSATLNGQLQTDDARSTFGVANAQLLVPAANPYATSATDTLVDRSYPELGPLGRATGTQSAATGLTLNGQQDGWRWTFTGNYDHAESKSFAGTGIDPAALQAAIAAGDIAADPFGRIAPQFLVFRPDDRATTVSDQAALDMTVSGSPLTLAAGEISTTFRIGASFSGFGSNSVRGGMAQSGRVSRDIADAQISIDVPITSRRRAFLEAFGNLSLNGNYAFRRLSDFGDLRTLGYGLTWVPIPAAQIVGSVTKDDVAPTAQQLGNPVLVTPGVRVYDFVNGTTALVTLIGGGNGALLASDKTTYKLGLNLTPFAANITLTADYLKSETRGTISNLPAASLASQLAFPDRYVRDLSGTLVSVDNRSVNFARSEQSQLRTGINFSMPLKTSQTQVDALRAAFRARFPDGPPGGPRGEGRGRGGGGGLGGGGGRVNLALYHTWHFTDRVTLRDGLPPIDLLNGGTIGGGGQPRHELELQATVSKNGFGGRLTGNWQSATRVDGLTAADDLRFSSLGTLNLRLFADVGREPWAIRSAPWLRGTRFTIAVNNIFDTRQRVTDAAGATPDNYLPGYIDPLGRSIRISIRKQFF